MSEKYADVLKSTLGPKDKVQYTWEGRYDGKYGFIVLSNEKVLFIEEHGFLHKGASLMLNDAYKNISKMESNEDQLELTKTDGAKQTLKTLNASIIKTKIEDLRKQAAND